jgi:hypothetical protein
MWYEYRFVAITKNSPHSESVFFATTLLLVLIDDIRFRLWPSYGGVEDSNSLGIRNWVATAKQT